MTTTEVHLSAGTGHAENSNVVQKDLSASEIDTSTPDDDSGIALCGHDYSSDGASSTTENKMYRARRNVESYNKRDGSLDNDDTDLDDYVLKLVEECQIGNKIHTADLDISENIKIPAQNDLPTPDGSHGFDNKSAVSITNINLPGYMNNASPNRTMHQHGVQDTMKGSPRIKPLTSRVSMAGNSCYGPNCRYSASTMIKYYDFSAHNDFSIKRQADLDYRHIVHASPPLNMLSPGGIPGRKCDSFNWKRLLRMLQKGAIAENALGASKLLTHRGQLQDSRIHVVQPKEELTEEVLLSVSGNGCHCCAERDESEQTTSLSSCYNSQSHARYPWNAAHPHVLTRTPGELSIMLGRAMNRRQTTHKPRKKTTSHSADSYICTHPTKPPRVGAPRPIAVTSPRKTCHISVHLPLSQIESSWDMKIQVRQSDGQSVNDTKSDPDLDIEGHFPPTIKRSPVISGKLSAGKLTSEQHQKPDSRGRERSMKIIKLPMVSPEGSLLSGGTVRKYRPVSQQILKSLHNPHKPESRTRRMSDDLWPDAPPGTPTSPHSPPAISENIHTPPSTPEKIHTPPTTPENIHSTKLPSLHSPPENHQLPASHIGLHSPPRIPANINSPSTTQINLQSPPPPVRIPSSSIRTQPDVSRHYNSQEIGEYDDVGAADEYHDTGDDDDADDGDDDDLSIWIPL